MYVNIYIYIHTHTAFFFLSLFIYLKRDKESASGAGGEGREGDESQAGSTRPSRGPAEPDAGLERNEMQDHDRDLSQNQEVDAQPTGPPRCPYMYYVLLLDLFTVCHRRPHGSTNVAVSQLL